MREKKSTILQDRDHGIKKAIKKDKKRSQIKSQLGRKHKGFYVFINKTDPETPHGTHKSGKTFLLRIIIPVN